MVIASTVLDDFISFLNHTPSPWHVVEECSKRLESAGFTALHPKESWSIQPGSKHYVVHEGGAISAWITPQKKPVGVDLIAAHTDSPTFRIKPNSEYLQSGMAMVGLEVYGAPLLSSWLNRELGIAGRLFVEEPSGEISRLLIASEDNPLIIPQLAIHLDREVNEKGLLLNRQDHLPALAALNWEENKELPIQNLLKQAVSEKPILGSDLFVYPLETAKWVGYQHQMISSSRLDNLCSVHAALTALIETKVSDERIKMALFWNHEEVGSNTAPGAASPFFLHLLERLLLALDASRDHFLKVLQQSIALSIDVAHALHPNYTEKHEPRHQALLGKGVVLKYSAQQRYATDGYTEALLQSLCRRKKLMPLQKIISRGDIPSGSTIGPIHASTTGMATVDIGIPQLSMHACRELISAEDQITLTDLLQSFLNE